MHKLLRYKKKIDKTHKGLGNLMSFILLCMKARKFCLIVGIAGTGKSKAMKWTVPVNTNSSIWIQEFTRSGLAMREKDLTGFRGVLVIEDLGNIDTVYSLKESVKSSIMLAYEHQISKLNASTNLNIVDFHGSVISSVQPVKMQSIIGGSDWEAAIKDKTTRYYQLMRPTKPNDVPPKVEMTWGKKVESVKLGKLNRKLYSKLETYGFVQWGRSRTREHIIDFLLAAAALDDRYRVTAKDYKCLLELLRPMLLEQYIIEKEGFESEKFFLKDHFCILSELASYHPCTFRDLQIDFTMSLREIQRNLQKVRMLYTPDPNDKHRLHPSEESMHILKECGYA